MCGAIIWHTPMTVRPENKQSYILEIWLYSTIVNDLTQ